MVKLKRLKINKYRNVRPGTELRFDDGYNLVLGQNGSGKTTLLGLVALVMRNDFTSLRDEAFAFEYELVNEHHRLTVMIESAGRAELLDDAEIPFSSVVEFNYAVKCVDDTSKTLFTIEGSPKGTLVQRGTESEELPAEHPFQAWFLLIHVAFEGELHNDLARLHAGLVTRFDESLGSFHALTGRESHAPGMAAPAMMRVVVAQAGLARVSTRLSKFAPIGIGQLFFATPGQPGGEIHIDLVAGSTHPPELEFLSTAARSIGALATSCRPASKNLDEQLRRGSVVLEIKGLAFTFKRANGMTLEHDLLSYGQKRLLSFFYYLATTRDVVIADELVNGLHHRWIEACMEAIGDRQAFLTSQNPLLFDYIPEFESVEQVQSRFITCKTEIVDGAEQLVWQNMPADHARVFYDAYKDDLEQVGEILIARGLW